MCQVTSPIPAKKIHRGGSGGVLKPLSVNDLRWDTNEAPDHSQQQSCCVPPQVSIDKEATPNRHHGEPTDFLHEVQETETLEGIALSHNLSLRTLLRLNRIPRTQMGCYPGQLLRVRVKSIHRAAMNPAYSPNSSCSLEQTSEHGAQLLQSTSAMAARARRSSPGSVLELWKQPCPSPALLKSIPEPLPDTSIQPSLVHPPLESSPQTRLLHGLLPPLEQPRFEQQPPLQPPLQCPREAAQDLAVSSQSEFLSTDQVRALRNALPRQHQHRPWQQLFSFEKDGYSLSTLFRRVQDSSRGRRGRPCLLCVQDSSGAVFGAFASHAWQAGERSHGTGATFLFTFHPGFEVFRWNGQNKVFLGAKAGTGTAEGHLSVGGGGEGPGLWLGGELSSGASYRSETFDNLCLAPEETFQVQRLEIWGFLR